MCAAAVDFEVPRRPLGSQGLVVPAQGLGIMGMTALFTNNPKENEEAGLGTIGRALELGINFFDTAWIYQDFRSGETNEGLLGKAIAKYGRDKFIVATKFGFVIRDGQRRLDSSPTVIRQQLQESLARLGTDYIDLYYQHRPDPNTPIETVMETLKELVQEGKIRYIGLSECTPDELRRAHAVHPVSAIEMEWSLFTRDIEAEVVPTARELGVGIVPYSPLGRGMLSARFEKPEDLPETDPRRMFPRMQGENLEANLAAVQRLKEFAAQKGFTPGQIALAWLHGQGNDVFPIPGTRNPSRLEENARAATIQLTPEELQYLRDLIPEAQGDRYPGMAMTWNSRSA